MSTSAYEDTLHSMEHTLADLAARVPAPVPVEQAGALVYRYREQTVHQALVQKLARIISGLHAAELLTVQGFFQEQGVLQRVLDELNDDVAFLALGVINDDLTPLHLEYIKAFYQEEFDKPGDALASSQKRPMVSRQRIRAYLGRTNGTSDSSSKVEALRTVAKVYSGYVHGASPHIMDMYGGDPPRWHVAGMLATPHVSAHRDDLWNNVYRSIASFALASKAFGVDALFVAVLEYMRAFAAASGQQFAHPGPEYEA
jgi:hypothetical protein